MKYIFLAIIFLSLAAHGQIDTIFFKGQKNRQIWLFEKDRYWQTPINFVQTTIDSNGIFHFGRKAPVVTVGDNLPMSPEWVREPDQDALISRPKTVTFKPYVLDTAFYAYEDRKAKVNYTNDTKTRANLEVATAYEWPKPIADTVWMDFDGWHFMCIREKHKP